MCLHSPGSAERMTIYMEERQEGRKQGRQADCVSGSRGSDASKEMEPSSTIGTQLVSKFTLLTLIPILSSPDVSTCC